MSILNLQPALHLMQAHEMASAIAHGLPVDETCHEDAIRRKDVEALIQGRCFKLDPHLTVAIIMQESSLLPSRAGVGPVDYGAFHFHFATVAYYVRDPSRLKGWTDLTYQVEAYVHIMNDKILKCRELGPSAWSCFHSFTPEIRAKYLEAVSRHYQGFREIN